MTGPGLSSMMSSEWGRSFDISGAIYLFHTAKVHNWQLSYKRGIWRNRTYHAALRSSVARESIQLTYGAVIIVLML